MPDMDGLMLAAAISAIRRWRRCPASCCVTAVSFVDRGVRTSVGIAECLVKPVRRRGCATACKPCCWRSPQCRAGETARTKPAVTPLNARILVAEDNEINQPRRGAAAPAARLHRRTAANGVEAVAALGRFATTSC